MDQDQSKNPSINVNGYRYEWENERGRLTFEGEDATLFWTDSALKSLLDTFEEISGHDAANVVLESSGYRMGIIVSNHFKKAGNIEELLKQLPAAYAAAGWGSVSFVHVDLENKQMIARFTDTWEYKVNKKQGKSEGGPFLPSHWAGTLSGLFGENVWYKQRKCQLSGDDYDEYEFFPSSFTPTENIHAYTRKQEKAEIEKLEQLVNQRTKDLEELVAELSAPLLPVLEKCVVVPLLGKYDSNRMEDLINKTIYQLPQYDPEYIIIDFTGFDISGHRQLGALFDQFIQATRMLGTECIFAGISPRLSIKLTGAKYNLSNVKCYTTLRHAVMYALSQEGKQVIQKK
ncbi:STAS domain-containing protein [Salirhabdus salicampi]|uniref:STAS domain-containing protein n=1 Tax=Salirhabdus salicampi TaxID=476102 RepID=UPI0020C503B4|nr:STAS domain-containing protein [Salirhabdus salicampi]MCP8617710.1 STAS domain-containing protein [Salirhabdus salicampi]